MSCLNDMNVKETDQALESSGKTPQEIEQITRLARVITEIAKRKESPYAGNPEMSKLLEDIRAGRYPPIFAGKNGVAVRTRREAVGNSLSAESVNGDGAGCPQAEENVDDSAEYDDMYNLNKD